MVEHSATHIVYVHGLWMNGVESLVLRRRIQRELSAPVHSFRYPSVSSSMEDVIASLQAFVRRLGPTRLHFIGHSLGGLVIYRFLERYPEQPPGRAVFLGTPSVTSRSAVAATQALKWTTPVLGKCVAQELLTEHERAWACGRDLGIIAGTRPLGLGQLFARFDEECDGTIGVSETRLSGATDHVCLPVSHMGMMLSAPVAHQTAHFLRTGKFALA